MTPFASFMLFIVPPGVAGCALVEAAFLSRRQRYDWRAFGVSVFDMGARIAVDLLMPLSLAAPLMHWAFRHRLTTLPPGGWPSAALLFVGQDFCYYWFHRAAHRVRWFWAHHAVHHSPNQLNLAAAFRIGVFGKLAGTTLFYAPLVWLGFAPRLVSTMLSLNLLYQFWLHAGWIPKLGWLEGTFNTPSAHRVHHAANLDYLDANFGGVLMLFDRLFGTYVAERDDLPCRYGLVHPLTRYNPLHVELAGWLSLARDLCGARSMRAFVGHLVMPPGWAPDGRGTTTAELRARAAASPQPLPPHSNRA